MPAFADTYAIAAPIIPAPSTPTFLAVYFSKPSGREPPELIVCRSKKNAFVMFFETWPVARLMK